MATTPERMAQLQEFAAKLKQDPKLKAQILGAPEPSRILPPATTTGVLKGIGAPVTSAIASKAAGEAIRQGTPEFQQEQAERERGRAGILPREGAVEGIPQIALEKLQTVPKEITETGGIKTAIEKTPEQVLKEKADAQRITEEIEKEFKIEAGARQAKTSFKLVASAATGLADALTKAYKEGGAGSFINKKKTQAVLALGENARRIGLNPEDFIASSDIPGRRNEIIFRIIPVLTQQGDKPGSVRLITSVVDKLGVSIPDLELAPVNARSQLAASLDNMFTFARAYRDTIQQKGLTNEQIESQLSDQDIQALGDDMIGLAKVIRLTPEEQKELDSIKKTAFKNMDEFILQGGFQREQRKQGLTPEEQAEFEELSKEFGG